MRRLTTLFVLLLAAAPLRAGDFDPKPIDDVVQKSLDAFHAPGAAVVIVKDDEVVYLKGFGVRKRGGDDPVTPDTVFAIASCSKAFTSALVALFVDQGKLTWDDKVRDHLDLFRLSDELADREVTFRDLLSHRTGMPRHDLLWAGVPTDSEDLIRRWCRAKPSTSFRSTWEYANVPFTTAGFVAGRLAGTDWAAATSKHLFRPLGMTASNGTAQGGEGSADHATPHYRGFDKSIKPIDWDRIDHAGGAGCVNSSARDMGRWLRFQLAGGRLDGKRVLSEKALKETHAPQMLVKPEGPFATYFPPKATKFVSYGLGWFVADYRGHLTLSHGGTLTGFRAQVMLVPEKRLGVCVLCNLRPSHVTEAVAKTALDHLLGLPPEDWVGFHTGALATQEFQTGLKRATRETQRKRDTKPSLEPEKYAGRYDERAYGRVEVTEAGGVLSLKWGKYTFRLDHYHYDTFTAVPVAPADEVFSFDRSTFDAHFRLGTTGAVESLTFLDQEFKRAAK